jgi:hypothetical protein
MVKPKLTKNTNENIRIEDIDGKTPTNMLLFGTPSMVFDGGQVESLFQKMLETGYARRCLFGLWPAGATSLSTPSRRRDLRQAGRTQTT